jgi:tRNA uracil 4-sulfurtransferase
VITVLMAELVLVRYGELALKSAPVRREFETALRRNILDQFVADGRSARVRADHGHLYLEADDASRATRLLARVFGVTSVSRVVEVRTDRAVISARLLELADARLPAGARFAVRARRTGSHPFTSQELARDLGGDVLERFADRHLRVDLEEPQVELFVEVRGPRTYLYFDRESGPGGLPLGVAGTVVAYVDGPRGALGAYLLMKRGCRAGFVATPDGSALVEGTLRRFDPSATWRATSGPIDASTETIGTLAAELRADAVVLPARVEEYGGLLGRWGDRVIFSPTVGLDDAEVEEQWAAIVQRAA